MKLTKEALKQIIKEELEEVRGVASGRRGPAFDTKTTLKQDLEGLLAGWDEKNPYHGDLQSVMARHYGEGEHVTAPFRPTTTAPEPEAGRY